MLLGFYREEEQAKIVELQNKGVNVEWLSGLCPVQADGMIDGHAFYFRARHDAWSLSVTRHETCDTDQALDDNAWCYTQQYGKDPEAGYMPFIEALGFIEQGAEKFRNRKD